MEIDKTGKQARPNSVDPYSTHMGFLEQHAHGMVVEFGCGLHSTPLLLEKANYVMSIEMQDAAWIGVVENSLRGGRAGMHKWQAINAVGPWAFLELYYPEKIDVAFIDGHRASRWACVNLMMMLDVPVIIAHDTEAKQYGWGKVRDGGYKMVTHKELTPWTTVWTKI